MAHTGVIPPVLGGGDGGGGGKLYTRLPAEEVRCSQVADFAGVPESSGRRSCSSRYFEVVYDALGLLGDATQWLWCR